MAAKYSFLPYLRQGMVSLIATEDNFGNAPGIAQDRAEIDIDIPLLKTPQAGGSDVPDTVSKSIKLKGPGDITGINSTAIVKISPLDWVTNFEPNYLPYIEFYDEDFPWRYTPAKEKIDIINSNEARLRPWLSLVALEENEFKMLDFNGILPAFEILKDAVEIFPDPTQIWAWAHVHVNDEISTTLNTGIGQLQSLLSSNPDKAVSRILCPRKLKPNTGYHVFLIPSFETGRLAGLGQSVPENPADGLAPAWTVTVPSGTPMGTQFPIYHQWFFKTGAGGDFESLIRLLRPKVLGNEVGKRDVDLQLPGNSEIELEADPKTIGLEGVLKPPTLISDPWPANNPDNFTEGLRTLLNQPNYAMQFGNPDPVIAPPIYGRWHAQITELNGNIDDNWVHEVNLDPRFRLFAGIGAEVVRLNQDKYMHIAWQQVGAVLEANSKIRQMQVAMQASAAMHDKHVKSLNNELLINISSPVHIKVKIPASTAYNVIKQSALPNSMLSGAFRRQSRPKSSMMQSLNTQANYTPVAVPVTTTSLIANVSTNSIQIAPPIQAPPGQLTLSIISSSNLNASFINNAPQLTNFTLIAPGLFPSTPVFGPNNTQAIAFSAAASNLLNTISSLPGYSYNTNPSLNLTNTASELSAKTEPRDTVVELAQKQITLHAAGTNQQVQIPSLDFILAAPRIVIPMYEELAKLGADWMMPGMNSIAQNSINLLMSDQKYVEAYMLGLNHEMARELLWREYPTDQRGTCFPFFWSYNESYPDPLLYPDPLAGPIDTNPNRDIKPIHLWKSGNSLSHLGSNTGRPVISNMLVLTIRGEILRKYPGTIIYMQKSKFRPNSNNTGYLFNEARDPDTTVATLYPLFSAKIEPDLYFLGFGNITPALAKGGTNDINNSGWFFVFQERAGELRFGADAIDPGITYNSTVATWNDVSWWHLLSDPETDQFINPNTAILPLLPGDPDSDPDNITWCENAAEAAYVLMQSPVKLYVHAKELMP